MSDRFASLKGNQTNMNKFQSKPKKRNSRFDSLSTENSTNNRFASNTFKRKPFNKRNNRRTNRRDVSNNKISPPNQIGKFTQVGTGEVSFIPQFQSKKMSQKEKKKVKKEEKLKVLDKKGDNDDWNSLQTDDDIALTLAMAQQYQYYTESEEEEEENDEVENADNSAW